MTRFRKMPSPADQVRPQRLSQLGELCRAIALVLSNQVSSSDRVFVAFRDLISMACSECNTRVSGEELYVLSQPIEGEDLTVQLRRLRLGFCALS